MKQPHLTAPQKLSSDFDIANFDCGEPSLDDWLRKRAAQNEESGASRTYVVLAGSRVAGYHSLAVGALAHEIAPGRIKRNMPDPVPMMVLGRLAVDREFQGRGLGQGLLRDAILRTTQVAEIAGIRGLLVHAINESAKRFYLQYGFIASPLNPMTLMITMADADREARG